LSLAWLSNLSPFHDVEGRRLPAAWTLAWAGLLAWSAVAAVVAADGFVVAEDAAPRWSAVVAAAVDAGFGVALVLRSRKALELAAWAGLWHLVAVGGDRLVVVPHLGLPGLGWAAAWAAAFAGRSRLLRPARRSRPVLGAVRLTAAMFVALEVASAVTVRLAFPALLIVREPLYVSPQVWFPGIPTIALLGSSPATVERLAGHPFVSILAMRLLGRYNFEYQTRGGVNSDLQVRIARSLADHDHPPDAFLIYAGLQDYNQDTSGLAVLREIAPLDRSQGALGVAHDVIESSHLVRLSLYLLRNAQLALRRDRSPFEVRTIFERYRDNIEAILALARERGMHVFVSTVVADGSRISPPNVEYLRMVNDYLKSLAVTHPDVSVVDFEARIAEIYPLGRLPDCEPFEAIPGTTECGDHSHLGPQGHELLADLFEPVIAAWKPAARGEAVSRRDRSEVPDAPGWQGAGAPKRRRRSCGLRRGRFGGGDDATRDAAGTTAGRFLKPLLEGRKP
jgi:hypothetical protein